MTRIIYRVQPSWRVFCHTLHDILQSSSLLESYVVSDQACTSYNKSLVSNVCLDWSCGPYLCATEAHLWILAEPQTSVVLIQAFTTFLIEGKSGLIRARFIRHQRLTSGAANRLGSCFGDRSAIAFMPFPICLLTGFVPSPLQTQRSSSRWRWL